MKYGLLWGIVLGLLFSGCRGELLHNISRTPIQTGETLSLPKVEKAVIHAGSQLGWVMTPQKPGHILGILNLRSHRAVVDIHYSPTEFSITYNDSSHLNYAEQYDGVYIHPNYNHWVKNLAKNIEVYLGVVATE